MFGMVKKMSHGTNVLTSMFCLEGDTETTFGQKGREESLGILMVG